MSKNTKFPTILKNCRQDKNLNQTELAQKTSLHQTAISHFEAGSRKPSFDNLIKLSNALEVTTDYLLGRGEFPPRTITIAGIEINLKLNKNLKSIDITCCQLGDIHGDVNTIFGDVNTVDGTVNLNVTGDVLGEVLSNIIYKSEIHLKRK